MLQRNRQRRRNMATAATGHGQEMQTHGHIHEPTFGMPGGFEADTLTTRAETHDPKHVPNGICWFEPRESEDEQAIKQRAASLSGHCPRKPTALGGLDKHSTGDLDIESQRAVAQVGGSGFDAAMWDQADADDEDMEEVITPGRRRSRRLMRKRKRSSEEKGNKLAKT